MSNIEIHKAELLKKYLNKSISNDERHELEKLALDDPFLFEAMEGYTEVSLNHEEVLTRIKSRLAKGKDTEGLRFPYAIAASLLVLYGFSFFFWQQNSVGEHQQSVAANEAKVSKVNSPIDRAMNERSIENFKLSEEIELEPELKQGSDALVEEVPIAKAPGAPPPMKKKAGPIASVNKDQVNYDFNDGVSSKKYTNEELGQVVVKEVIAETSEERNTTNEQYMNGNAVPAADAPKRQEGSFENTADEISLAEVVEDMDVEEEMSTEAIDEVIIVAAEKKAESIPIQSTSNAMSDEASSSLKNGKSKNKSTTRSYNDEFEKYLYGNIGKYLSDQQLKKVQKGVALQFIYSGNQVSNFQVSPEQEPKVNALLLELIKGGVNKLQITDGVVEYVLF